MTEIPYLDHIEHFAKIGSTNARAVTMVRNHEIQGHFLLIADEQTGGHGRSGKSWYSPPGGLWFTAGFQNLPAESNLTLFLGVCVRRAVAELLPVSNELLLKWPNDLMLNGRKLVGILVEKPSLSAHHIAGIGINTNLETIPPELNATSLQIALGHPVDNQDLLRSVFAHFFALLPVYVEQGLACVLGEYRDSDFLRGRAVTLQTEFAEYHGQAVGIGRDGALLLRLPGGMIQPFYAGSVMAFSKNQEND